MVDEKGGGGGRRRGARSRAAKDSIRQRKLEDFRRT